MEGRPGKEQIGVIGAAQSSPEIYGIALSEPKPKVATSPEVPWSVASWSEVESPIVSIKTWELGGWLLAAAGGREAVGMFMGMRR